MPPITGRSSSSAVAKRVREIPASSTSAGSVKLKRFSVFITGSTGKSMPFWPTMLNRPFSELMTAASVSGLISKVRGCSENSLRVSSSILAGSATVPLPVILSRCMRVMRVDSRSEAVISTSLPLILNRKLSRMGRVFFELITLLMA